MIDAEAGIALSEKKTIHYYFIHLERNYYFDIGEVNA
jgi:hypothetical protein